MEVTPFAGRIEPAKRTVRLRTSFKSVLSQRKHIDPVFDISAVLVQYPVPFVALGRTTFYITRTSVTTSHGRRTQRIVHTACGIVLAENQTCGIQIIPSYRMRYGIVRNE